MVAVVQEPYRWTLGHFVRAFDAGVFEDQRVELIDGVVWPVSMGPWHGGVAANVIRLLPHEAGRLRYRITQASMVAAGSLPDPDCSVIRAGAEPTAPLGERLVQWSPRDVPLIVEVGDATLNLDLTTKAARYATQGYPCYWVVHRAGVAVHTEPGPDRYARRDDFRAGDDVPVPYAPGLTVPVDRLLDVDG